MRGKIKKKGDDFESPGASAVGQPVSKVAATSSFSSQRASLLFLFFFPRVSFTAVDRRPDRERKEYMYRKHISASPRGRHVKRCMRKRGDTQRLAHSAGAEACTALSYCFKHCCLSSLKNEGRRRPDRIRVQALLLLGGTPHGGFATASATNCATA